MLDMLRSSGLTEEGQLRDYLRQTPLDLSALSQAELSNRLIQDGMITNFQARQLLAGKFRGFILANKYKLLEVLGTGGMGQVFLCEHIHLRRLVAVKVLPKEKTEQPGVVERFYREARAVAALNHPNIVRAHDVDKDQQLHFLVMEFVDGVNLQDLVNNHGPLEATRAAHYIAQAARGLQHAHEAGWVHRDVKPGNILIDRQGGIKILDLGLARLFLDDKTPLTQLLDNKSVLGTADYLAPEQALNSHDVDIRADVYSLGATFYFLLSGKAPFEEDAVAQKLVAQVMREPTPLTTLRPGLPESMAAIVRRMMATRIGRNASRRLATSPWPCCRGRKRPLLLLGRKRYLRGARL